MNRPASLVAGVFLIALAVAQLCRVVFGVSLVAAAVEIPMWPSVIAAIVLASLAFWLLKERNSTPR